MADSDGSYELTSNAATALHKTTTSSTRCIFNTDLHPSFDASLHSSLVLKSSDKCYPLVLKYIGANIVRELGACSYSMDLLKNGESCGGCCDRYDYDAWRKEHEAPSKNGSGIYSSVVFPDLGMWEFKGISEEPVFALHQVTGEPVADERQGPAQLVRLVLFVRTGSLEALTSLLCKIASDAEKSEPNMFKIFRYNIRCGYWRHDVEAKARPLDSVILPDATKAKITEDLGDFFSKETKAFYEDHGIPYRRAYLFHGVPGGGKTSLIQAIAGHYGRSVCYLTPNHPDMTDDALKSAIQTCPARSIVVLEDVDALFGEDRKGTTKDCPLTFSGLLNALDGVGSPAGQIFVLTTNHRERLDPALIRNGRVDVHIGFENVTDEQITKMFRSYYPSADGALADKFAAELRKSLDGKEISAAALQGFFVLVRKKTADEAAGATSLVIEEINERANERAKADAMKKFAVGDSVKCDYKQRGKIFPGKIKKVTGDTFTVAFEDGDVEKNVKKAQLTLVKSKKKSEESEESDGESEEEEEEEKSPKKRGSKKKSSEGTEATATGGGEKHIHLHIG